MGLDTGSTPNASPDPLKLRGRLAVLGSGFALLLLASFAAALALGIQREVEHALVSEVELLARSGVAQWSMVEHERREALHLPPEPTDPIVDLHEQTDDQLVQWFTGDLVLMDELGNSTLGQRRQLPTGRTPAPDRWRGGIALWKPVVSQVNRWHQQPQVLGWVYVAISDADTLAEQARLLRGVGFGALTALLVALLVGQRLINSTFLPLQRQVEALERFTGDASHELRHPLTTLRTLVATHRDHAVTPEVMERIDALAARLGRLLDDLLYLSRVDQGIGEGKALRQHWDTINLGELLEDVIADCQLQADPRGVQLVLREPPIPLLMRGQPDRLMRLFNNLLLNAVRFSPDAGVVTIDLSRRQRPQGNSLAVQISDQGPGIPEQHRKAVFERFWRVPGQSDRHNHSGLGLAIARAIVRQHGGDLSVEAAPDSGASLTVVLPGG